VQTTGSRAIELLSAIYEYEKKMHKYGTEAVKESLAQMNSKALIHKPVIGRVILAGQGTMLRVANHLPPVKQKFEVALSKSRGLDRVED
jgi:hypothetical protein